MRSERSPEPTWDLRSAARSLSAFCRRSSKNAGAQDRHGLLPVAMLRALLLHKDYDPGRQMGEADRRFGLVDVLAAGALRPHRVDLQIRLVDVDVDLLGLGQHRDRGGGGVDPALRLGVGHALDAMHAALELETGEHAATFDRGDNLLEAAHGAFSGRKHLQLPPVQVGIALVHAKKVAGEEGRFVAARAGAHLEDGALLVGRILRQQRKPDRLFQVRQLLDGRRALLLGKGTHLGIGGGVRQHRVEIGEFAALGAIRPDRRHKLVGFGELA